MVAPQPPSVPGLTWFWSGGVEDGYLEVGLAGPVDRGRVQGGDPVGAVQ